MAENAPPVICPHCGKGHMAAYCPRVRAVEYFPDGTTVRRIEYHREERDQRG